MAGPQNKIALKENRNHNGSLTKVFLFGTILGLFLFTAIAHRHTLVLDQESAEYEPLERLKYFRHCFFTGWNFVLQITFLILAVTDELFKLTRLSKLQRPVEKIRIFLFESLVFPSSLLVMTIFWSIWHIDRELIFPKVIDEFYPSWFNHTLHTFIVIPLIIEVLVQFQNAKYTLSRTRAAIVTMVYCILYQTLYLSIYFRHDIWLYPIYKIFTWPQRIMFMLGQFFLMIIFQQIGITLLQNNKMPKTKSK